MNSPPNQNKDGAAVLENGPPGEPAGSPKLALERTDILNLHLQEYSALRSEQRTRLDSANRIIHYSAVILGAFVVGLASLYKPEDPTSMKAFRVVLLLVPFVVLPFALTQQNEEILVRHIGNYLRKLKADITEGSDVRYWNWESFHPTEQPSELQLTGFFRAGLLIFFSVMAQLSFYGLFWDQLIWPHQWLQTFRWFSLPWFLGLLQFLDVLLTIFAISIGIKMFRRMRRAKDREEVLKHS